MSIHKSPILLFIAAVVTPVLLLQAWDSDTFESSALVISMVLLAIAVPVITAILLPKDEMLIGAGIVSLLLLFSARFISSGTLQRDLFTMLPLLGILLYLSRLHRLKLRS